MKRNKLLALLLSAVLLLSLLAGCGGKPTGNPGPTKDPGSGTQETRKPAAPVELNVVTSYGGDDGNRKNYENAVKAYEEATGNKILDASASSNEEWKAKVLTDFETGTEPDVLFFFTNADAEPIVKAGKVVDIAAIRAEYPDYGSNMRDSMLAAASDGKSYAVPSSGFWENMFVNTKVLEDCGVAVPGPDYTWDQFLKDCQSIKDKGYKVVLVDDESLIVEGLRKVVDWAGHHCQVAAAHDAASGARAIREHRPDILFTDIKMPGEDGLTMLAGLKGEFPRMQIAVLTGYRDFEYAQRAIRLGVARFLLKPSKMEELEEALDYMTGVLDRLSPDERAQAEDRPEPEDAANSFVVRQAKAYIARRCAEKLTLQEVADHCFVSQWHLSKLLNRYLGQPFYDLLNAERVRRAKELLEDPALRISEIAERVGYADTAHFSRVFKKLEGVSAGEWRNLHCGR